MENDLMAVVIEYTDYIPPDLVEKARGLGWSDEKIKQEWIFQVEGVAEYNRSEVYEGFEDLMESESE